MTVLLTTFLKHALITTEMTTHVTHILPPVNNDATRVNIDFIVAKSDFKITAFLVFEPQKTFTRGIPVHGGMLPHTLNILTTQCTKAPQLYNTFRGQGL